MANDLLGTVVILVRHAERDDPTPSNRDPHLNAAGRARARRLIHVLGGAGIEAIYNSDAVRSKETARPLAEHLDGMSTKQINEPQAINDDILANHVGRTVLVIGHSDTVPDLINLLSGSNMPEIKDEEFDNLFVVTLLAASSARVTALKYGEQS